MMDSPGCKEFPGVVGCELRASIGCESIWDPERCERIAECRGEADCSVAGW